MRIYKFDGNATASVRGMQHVAKLIQDNTSKIVVLSAPKDVTKHLGEVAASFFNRNIEEAHDKITRLEFQFIDFANELLTNESPMNYLRTTLSSTKPSGAFSTVSRQYGNTVWNLSTLPMKRKFWHKESY